jgi:glucose/arabinose dehydrogenase
MKVSNLSLLTLTTLAMSLVLDISTIYGPAFQTANAQASINDPSLQAELVTGGMSFPTSMAFVDDNNILVLEKDGAVRLVSNGVMQDTPVLQVPVESKACLASLLQEARIMLHHRGQVASQKQYSSTLQNREKRN